MAATEALADLFGGALQTTADALTNVEGVVPGFRCFGAQPEGAGEPVVGREPRPWTPTTDPAILQTVKSLPGISESLMRRLAEVAPAAEEAFAATPLPERDKHQEDEREHELEPQRKQAQPQVEHPDPRPAAKDEYDGLFDLPEPPEATVTFVVREAPRSKQA